MEKQSEEWKNARLKGKENRLQETDIIKQLVEYAKNQGSIHADKLYMTYTKLAKRILPGSRDNMNTIELNTMSMIENIILQAIRADIAADKHYKEIYKDCKARLEQFADIAYLDTICTLTGYTKKLAEIPA